MPRGALERHERAVPVVLGRQAASALPRVMPGGVPVAKI